MLVKEERNADRKADVGVPYFPALVADELNAEHLSGAPHGDPAAAAN